MAAHDPGNHSDADMTIRSFTEVVTRAGDLTPLMAGGLGDRIETIISLCRRLPAIEAAGIHLVCAKAQPSAGGAGVPAGPIPHSEGGPLGIPWPTTERLAQVAASAKACYGSWDGKDLPDENRRESRGPTPGTLYMVPLGPRGRVLGVLLAGSRHAGGIPTATLRTLDRLAPVFFLALENAILVHQTPSPASPDQGQEGRRPGGALEPSRVDAIAHLAHDLKNAMTTVSTFLQLLPAKWGEAHFRSTFYPAARDEALRVNDLVNAMLDWKRHRSPQRAPVDVHALLRHILARKTPLAEQRRLRLHFRAGPGLPSLRVDQEAIAEAIVNLLSNAMEASPRGGRIEIRLAEDAMPNGQPAVRLDIQDSGPGVAQALGEAIFAPYVTTKRGGPSTGGTGLGLAIARRNVEAHGGRIAVETPAEGGALFRVLLPVERRRHL